MAEQLGEGVLYAHLDVTDPGQWEATVTRTIEAFEGLSILVNNAGIVSFGSVETCSQEQWARVMDVNPTGVFNGIKAALPALKSSGVASIINIFLYRRTSGLRATVRVHGVQIRRHRVDQERGLGPRPLRHTGELSAPGCCPYPHDRGT